MKKIKTIKWKARKGYKYLEDIEPGTLVKAGLQEAVYLSSSSGSSSVIVLEYKGKKEDAPFYLGKRSWANKTEVKEIKWEK